jgi:hypothetical protein
VQLKVVAEANPFCGVMEITEVPEPPGMIVSELGDAAIMNEAGGRLMIYAADATGLFEYPAATAIAWRVSVTPTLIAPVYRVEDADGVEPSVV